MADENTKIIDPIQAETVEVNAEVPLPTETPPLSTPPYRSGTPFASEVQDAQGLALGSQSQAHPLAGEEKTSVETKAEEVPVVSEAEPLSSTVEPSIQDETIKVEEKKVEEPVQEPKVVIEIPVVESKPKEAPVVAPVPEPVAIPTHLSPLEALGASFVANMKRARELLVKARAVLSSKRKKKIEKIMTLFIKKSKIVNKDVRELLTTTEHTATDYLNVLVKDGKIKKEGKSSHAYYTKI
jgi:hypothetical protein